MKYDMKLIQARDSEIVQRRNAGEPVSSIAKDLGISKARAYMILGRAVAVSVREIDHLIRRVDERMAELSSERKRLEDVREYFLEKIALAKKTK